ncbi:GYDIA family GHMP kinase [Carboxylicivirga sp. N1Y90]|uniref:GYDIA family GHMP kinase n=1 Tax=Carboxylicivirga fragile TaxID=3417571 RepID=UPI003D34C8AF|nr:hypothetical protein [Marinilabiliaceae bacterium N1Y90]
MNQQNTPYFHANGKLLLSGEYLVLIGAKALAIPLNKGQSLSVHPSTNGFLSWEAMDPNGLWFRVIFDDQFNVIKSTDPEKASGLQNILKVANELNSNTSRRLSGKLVKTLLEFDPNWGWGSSSTLIANLAQWLEVDPYILLELTFGGSGYDIACATSSRPLFYQRDKNQVKVSTCDFNPQFKDQLYFIYSGKKQSSRNEIARFDKSKNYTHEIKLITEIGELMAFAQNINDFGRLMNEHEKIISSIVHHIPIKNEHFSDFRGYTKTLGAWGGDFFMALSDEGSSYIKEYFAIKGLNTCFSFDEIALMNNDTLN